MRTQAIKVFIAAFLLMAANIMIAQSLTVHEQAYMTEHAFSDTSMMPSSMRVISALLGFLFAGTMIRKMPLKMLIVADGIAVILCYTAIACTSNIYVLSICSALCGLLSSVGLVVGAQAMITWHFEKAQPILLGLLTALIALISQIEIHLESMEGYLLPTMTMVQGLILGGAIILCGIFLVADSAEQHSIRPGNTTPVRYILKQKVFWIILAAIVLLDIFAIQPGAFRSYQNIDLGGPVTWFLLNTIIPLLSRCLWPVLFGFIVYKKGVRVGVATVSLTAIAALLLTGVVPTGEAALLVALIGSGTFTFLSLFSPIIFATVLPRALIGYLIGFTYLAMWLDTIIFSFFPIASQGITWDIVQCIGILAATGLIWFGLRRLQPPKRDDIAPDLLES